MTAPTVIPPGGGEVVGDSPDRRVEIVSDHPSLHATVSRFGPRRDGADLHVHRRHTDLFYVLEGELTVRLGTVDEAVAVPAGMLARVPPLVVHGFRNAGDADVRYLNFHAPGVGFADYLRALRDGRTLVYDQEEPPAEGERSPTRAIIGGATVHGGRVALLAEVPEIAIAEVLGEASGPPHVHLRHAVSFYVLEGELALRTGEGELRAAAGSWVQVPPGVPHAVAATGRYLDIHTPSCGFGAFLHGAAAEFDQQPAPTLGPWTPSASPST